jgi:hypothetical protein
MLWESVKQKAERRVSKMGDYYFQSLLLSKLDNVIRVLDLQLEENRKMSEVLDRLVAEVAAVRTVEESAVTLINGLVSQLQVLSAQLTAQGLDNAVVEQAIADLQNSTTALSDAVAANTR